MKTASQTRKHQQNDVALVAISCHLKYVMVWTGEVNIFFFGLPSISTRNEHRRNGIRYIFELICGLLLVHVRVSVPDSENGVY